MTCGSCVKQIQNALDKKDGEQCNCRNIHL